MPPPEAQRLLGPKQVIPHPPPLHQDETEQCHRQDHSTKQVLPLTLPASSRRHAVFVASFLS